MLAIDQHSDTGTVFYGFKTEVITFITVMLAIAALEPHKHVKHY